MAKTLNTYPWTSILIVSLATIAAGCTSRGDTSPAGAASATIAAPAFPAASAIVARFASQDSCKDVTATMEVTGDTTTSSVPLRIRIRQKRGRTSVATLMEVLSPPADRDKALLSVAENGKPAESFAFLPGLRKIVSFPLSRDITIGKVRVTVQEMLGLAMDLYSHEITSESEFAGVPVYEIRSTAGRDLNTRYRTIRGLFRKDNHMPVELNLYSQTGGLAKRIRFPRVSQRQGYWSVEETTVEDAAQKQVMHLKLLDIKYDQNLPDTVFTERNLLKLAGQPPSPPVGR